MIFNKLDQLHVCYGVQHQKGASHSSHHNMYTYHIYILHAYNYTLYKSICSYVPTSHKTSWLPGVAKQTCHFYHMPMKICMAVRWSEFVMRSSGTRLLDTSAESIYQELHIKVLKGKESHPLPPQALQHPQTLCQTNFKRHALDKDT